MASAAIEETDYFALSASAARRLKVSPATLIRFEAIRLQLAAHGVRRNDKRIPLWIAPILCTTPEARRNFLEGFPEDPEDVRRPTRDERDPASEGKSNPKPKVARPIGWRNSMLGSILLLPLAGILLMTQLPSDPVVVNQSVPAATTNSTQSIPKPSPTPKEPEPADDTSVTTMAMLVLPSLLVVGYIIWLRRRRRSIRRDNAPAPDRSVQLIFANGLQNFLTDRTLRKALGNLRRHRPVASTKLNVPAAIRATVRSAGFPQMRYGFRPRSPDYLLLNERESPADHLTMIGRVMATRMTEEHVAHGRYEYFGDPRRLQLIERGAPAGVFPLTTVLARHDGARVMLFQESHDCFAEETSPEWLARIAATERPVLLNPRSREAWGAAESRLTALGLGIVSPSGGGIVDYGDYLNATGNLRRRLAGSNTARFDLPESLARDRDLLLDNAAPLDTLVAELVTDLELWLDEGGIYWLRALALFPYIDPGFTVFLGTALHEDDGKALMDEARFIDLARLPWLRAGRMPDWMRRALVRGLTPAQLEAATNAIQTFLMPAEQAEGATAIDFSRGEDRKLRKRLLDWLKLTPESVLSDQLLIEALGGRAPDELGLEAPKTLLQHSRKLWAGNEARAAAIAVAATIAIGAWQLPWSESPPPPAQPDAEELNIVVPTITVRKPEPPSDLSPKEAAVEDALNAVMAAEPPVANRPVNTAQTDQATQQGPTSERRITPPRPTPTGNRQLLADFSIDFASERADLTPNAQGILKRVAQAYFKEIKSDQGSRGARVQVIIQPHTMPEPSPKYLEVSQRRARAIKAYLSSMGIPPRDMLTEVFLITVEPASFSDMVNIFIVEIDTPPPTAN